MAWFVVCFGASGTMTVTEELQGLGSFTLSLKSFPHELETKQWDWSTMYILDGRYDGLITSNLLDNESLYAGVLLDRVSSNPIDFRGHSAAWYLGNIFGVGPLLSSELEYIDALPSVVLAAAWALFTPDPPITLGMVTNPPSTVPNPLFTGNLARFATLREVVDQIASACYCSWRVNNDSTIDFGPAENLFNVTDPYIASRDLGIRTNRSKGMLTSSMTSFRSGRSVTSVIVNTPDGDACVAIDDIFGLSRGQMVATTSGTSDDALSLALRILNGKARIQAGSTLTFENDARVLYMVHIGDTVMIHDPSMGWGTDTIEIANKLDKALPMVCVQKSWEITQDMSVVIDFGGGDVVDITHLVERVRNQNITLTCGDIPTLRDYQLLGTDISTGPIADVFGTP